MNGRLHHTELPGDGNRLHRLGDRDARRTAFAPGRRSSPQAQRSRPASVPSPASTRPATSRASTPRPGSGSRSTRASSALFARRCGSGRRPQAGSTRRSCPPSSPPATTAASSNSRSVPPAPPPAGRPEPRSSSAPAAPGSSAAPPSTSAASARASRPRCALTAMRDGLARDARRDRRSRRRHRRLGLSPRARALADRDRRPPQRRHHTRRPPARARRRRHLRPQRTALRPRGLAPPPDRPRHGRPSLTRAARGDGRRARSSRGRGTRDRARHLEPRGGDRATSPSTPSSARCSSTPPARRTRSGRCRSSRASGSAGAAR